MYMLFVKCCRHGLATASLALLAILTGSCATKGHLKSEIGALEARIDELQAHVQELETHSDTLEEQAKELARIGSEALQRAQEAGKAAEGKLLYETVISTDNIRFGRGEARLTDEAKAALDDLVRSFDGHDFYLEIQGHTDSEERDPENLGLRRANAVRLYLNSRHRLVLHHLNVVSYGASAPIVDNDSGDGQATNRRVSIIVLAAGESVRTAQYPLFPWPPPAASGTEVIPPNLLISPSGETTLRDVDTRIQAALEVAGYFGSSYFAVPGGFALVTRMEQIGDDGRPKPALERWSVGSSPKTDFTLLAYLRALFTAQPGYYRVIVFVVTPLAFSQSTVSISAEKATNWLQAGTNRLPSTIGALKFKPVDYSCTALIYEFQRPSESDSVTVRIPGVLPARTHLERAGVWSALKNLVRR